MVDGSPSVTAFWIRKSIGSIPSSSAISSSMVSMAYAVRGAAGAR